MLKNPKILNIFFLLKVYAVRKHPTLLEKISNFFYKFENSKADVTLIGNKDPLLELDKIYYIGNCS